MRSQIKIVSIIIVISGWPVSRVRDTFSRDVYGTLSLILAYRYLTVLYLRKIYIYLFCA